MSAEVPDVLYHGTSVSALYGILSAELMEIGFEEDLGSPGVSFTTAWHVAEGYAATKQEADVEDSFPQDYDHVPEGECDGVILALDGKRLAAAGYVVTPFQWTDESGFSEPGDFEWRLAGEISNVLDYVVGIHVSRKDIDWHVELYGASPLGSEEFVAFIDAAFARIGGGPSEGAITPPPTPSAEACRPGYAL